MDLALVQLWEQGPVVFVSWVFWVIASIILHELGHGFAALWQGDPTPRILKRLTLNPLVHMGWASLLCFALFGFAWGLMPVDPRNFRSRWGVTLVALAGPMVNFLLALLALTALGVLLAKVDFSSRVHSNVAEFLLFGGAINIFLMLFNLFPMPPLDGSAVLGGLGGPIGRAFSNPQVQTYGALALLVLFFAGIGTKLFAFSFDAAHRYADFVAGALLR